MARTQEEIIEIVNGLGYELLSEYKNKNFRRIIIRDKIGYIYDSNLNDLIKNHIPNFVSSNNPYAITNIILWLKLNNSEFELCKNNVYKTTNDKLKFYHKTCKEYFLMRWNSVLQGQGCPVCSGQQVGKYNNLEYLFPEIAKEWHPTKNGNLTPNDVSYGSNKKVWWICPKGHEYFSVIYGRVRGNNCKRCSDSRNESTLAKNLKQWCLDNIESTQIEYKIIKNPNTGYWLPFDIYLYYKNENIYIEIHGSQHYKLCQYHRFQAKRKNITPEEEFKYAKNLDKLKKNFAKKNGLFIEIDLRKIKTLDDAISYIKRKIAS